MSRKTFLSSLRTCLALFLCLCLPVFLLSCSGNSESGTGDGPSSETFPAPAESGTGDPSGTAPEGSSLPLPDREAYQGEETSACYEALCSFFGGETEERKDAPDPAGLLASLFAEEETPYFSLYHISMPRIVRYGTGPAGGYLPERASYLLTAARFERSEDAMDRESVPNVSEFLFFSSRDGAQKLYIFPTDGGQMTVLTVEGDTASSFSAPVSGGEDGSVFSYESFRMLFDSLESESLNAAFPAENAEEACRLFAEEVRGYPFLLASPGSLLKASAYMPGEYSIREQSESGDAVILELESFLAPLDPARRAFAEMVPVPSGENAGMGRLFSEYLLERGEDGSWRCTASGIGLELP